MINNSHCLHEMSKIRLESIEETIRENGKEHTFQINLRCECGKEIYFGKTYELKRTVFQ